jgi:hypothetical protein
MDRTFVAATLAWASAFGAIELVARMLLRFRAGFGSRAAIDGSSWCACLLHSLLVSVGAALTLAAWAQGGPVAGLAAWAPWAPLTLGYWIQDAVLTTVPMGDVVLFVHHAAAAAVVLLSAWLGAAYGPASEAPQVAGEVTFVTALAFTAEVSTCLLAARWVVAHLPGGAPARPALFTCLSTATLGVWVTTRGPVFLFALWRLWRLLGSADLDGEAAAPALPWLLVFAGLGVGIFLLSALFTRHMLRGGWRAFVTPRAVARDKDA